MKRLVTASLSAAIVLGAAAGAVPEIKTAHAENPIIQTAFTPDPAPVVFGDELWMFTGRDRNADNDFYYMTGWQAFSTTDMKNWTNHGCILEDDDFSWCNPNDAWASQCIERNGKYYFYFTTTNKSGGGRAIGVGVADKPEGPYKDVLGKPLCGPNWDYIDPTVMIDDDGQAWLMFGNPKCYYVKLNKDMISLDGSIQSFDMTASAFGSGKNGSAYGEGPWICKHDSLYYLVYAGFYGSEGGESICYSYGPSVTGPWKFGGQITPESNCFTTHGGTIDYKGHSYLFYHKNGLKGGGVYKRSAAVEEFKYNSDGTIPMVKPTDAGPDQLEAFDPFRRVEAETGSWFSGIEVEPDGNGGQCVGYIENGDYIKVSGVDFGNGADKFTASAASDSDGGKIVLHTDSITGPIVGTCNVPGTGGWKEWTEVSATINAKGRHDLYIEFTGDSGYLMNVDWWKCSGDGSVSSSEPTTQPTKSDEPVSTDEYYFHSTFESGADSWEGRFTDGARSSSNAYMGSNSFAATGRTASWNGAIMELGSQFKPGGTYSFSSNVMFTKNKAKTVNFLMKLQYTDSNGEACYDTIAEGVGVANGWTQLANTSYTIPSDAEDISIYIETESGTCDFYVDEVYGGPKGAAYKGAGIRKVYAPGDLNYDGCIDIFDVSLAKKAALTNYKDPFLALAADADRSTTNEVADLILLQKFVMGKITEFPDNTPEPPLSTFDYDPALQFREAPGDYLNPCSQKGTITTETYNGINGSNTLKVYTPYGYDPSRKYNIFYLMHGGGENENTIFSDDVKLHNILDHMIMNGELEPLIVVTPTFNKCTAQTFYKEFRQSVIPFVEGKYSTYAESTSAEDIAASRMHRAYGGFSMGSASTWAVLVNSLDIVGYYMPLSGDNWESNDGGYGKAKSVADAVDRAGLDKDEYFIFCATGSEDIAYQNMNPQMDEMKKMSQFVYTSDFSQGNFYYLVADGKTHWWGYVRHYVYDALPYFFHEGQ